MNFEIIVKSKDGRYIVLSPNFPGCDGEGQTIEEAVEKLVENIANSVSQNIKRTLKDVLKEIIKNPPASSDSHFSGVLAKFPISLN